MMKDSEWTQESSKSSLNYIQLNLNNHNENKRFLYGVMICFQTCCFFFFWGGAQLVRAQGEGKEVLKWLMEISLLPKQCNRTMSWHLSWQRVKRRCWHRIKTASKRNWEEGRNKHFICKWQPCTQTLELQGNQLQHCPAIVHNPSDWIIQTPVHWVSTAIRHLQPDTHSGKENTTLF